MLTNNDKKIFKFLQLSFYLYFKICIINYLVYFELISSLIQYLQSCEKTRPPPLFPH